MTLSVKAAMKTTLREIAWMLFQGAVQLRMYRLIAWLFACQVQERGTDGKLRRPDAAPKGDGPTLLILSAESFRGDPECLAKRGTVRVLELPERWVSRLMYQFYPRDLITSQLVEFMNPDPSGKNWACKQRYRQFLKEFLPRFYDDIGVDCVIGHLVHYVTEVDWGAVSGQLGFPYVVIQRESLLVTKYAQDGVRTRLEALGKFEGQHIVVHNTATEQVLLSSKFVVPELVSDLGCMRMDDFLSRIDAPKVISKRRKRVVFFTFAVGAINDDIWHPVFSGIHNAFAQLAIRHPELDVMIKSKPKFLKSWRLQLMRAFEEAGIRPDEIPNLEITGDGAAQELILNSDVICGLNSITTLEAAISGKPVILPCIGLFNPDFEDRIYFREYFHLFDVVTSARELEDMVMKKCENPEVSTEITAGRRALFEKYVSKIGTNSTDSCIELINSVLSRTADPVNRASPQDDIPSLFVRSAD